MGLNMFNKLKTLSLYCLTSTLEDASKPSIRAFYLIMCLFGGRFSFKDHQDPAGSNEIFSYYLRHNLTQIQTLGVPISNVMESFIFLVHLKHFKLSAIKSVSTGKVSFFWKINTCLLFYR